MALGRAVIGALPIRHELSAGVSVLANRPKPSAPTLPRHAVPSRAKSRRAKRRQTARGGFPPAAGTLNAAEVLQLRRTYRGAACG